MGLKIRLSPPPPPEIFSFKTLIFFVGRNSPNPWDFGEVHLFGSPQWTLGRILVFSEMSRTRISKQKAEKWSDIVFRHVDVFFFVCCQLGYYLGVGFKDFLLSYLPGEMICLNWLIFFRWVAQPLTSYGWISSNKGMFAWTYSCWSKTLRICTGNNLMPGCLSKITKHSWLMKCSGIQR